MWMLLLLPLALLAQTPPARECHHVAGGRLDDGYHRCAGLPFEVRFEGETQLERFSHLYDYGEGVTKRTAASETDAAGVSHHAHGGLSGDARDKAVEQVTAAALKAISEKPPEVLERGSQEQWKTTRFRADVKGIQVTGEVRATFHGGHAVALFVWGPKGGRYAPGAPAAKAFLDSFRAVVPSGRLPKQVEPDLTVSLPPGTWDRGGTMYPAKPLGRAWVDGLTVREDYCDRVKDVGTALGPDLEVESPKLTPVEVPQGKGFLVEGARKTGDSKEWVTTYLFCNGRTAPLRVTIATPEPSPAAIAFVRELAESATGPARRDLELRVAMTGNYWPLHWMDEDSCYGLEMELAHTLMRELGKKKVVCMPREGLDGLSTLEAVAKGKADVALSAITPTPERLKQVDFTPPYLTLQYRLVRREAPDVTALAQLAGKTVAIPSGTGEAALRQVLEGANLVVAKSTGEALKLLRAEKADYIAGEDVALLEVMDPAFEALTGPSLAPSPLAMAVPKGQLPKYTALLAKLAPELEVMRTRYRPGHPPEELGFGPCDEPAQPWTTLDARTMKFRHDPKPARTGAYPVDDEKKLCVSEVFRAPNDGPSKKFRAELKRQLSALAEAIQQEPAPEGHRDIERKSAKVDWSTVDAWMRVPGLWVNVITVDVEQECVVNAGDPYEDRWSCPVRRFIAVAIKGDQVVSELLKTEVRFD